MDRRTGRPLVGSVPGLERVANAVRGQVVEEARASVLLAVATSAVVATVGASLVALAAPSPKVTGRHTDTGQEMSHALRCEVGRSSRRHHKGSP